MLRLCILPVLGLIAALGFACGDSGDDLSQSIPTASPKASATSVTTTAAPPTTVSASSAMPTSTATLTYTDQAYRYSFEYPAAWYLSPAKDNGGIVILYSYNLASIPSGEAGMPVSKDKLKVVFSVTEGVNKSLQDWLSETRNSPGQPPAPTIVSSSDVTLGGKSGLVEVSDEDGLKHITYYLVLGGGRILAISGVPADSQVWPQFEPVLATLQFAP
jgi:hypothetical protein